MPRLRLLWQRLAEIYGVRFTSAYGEDAGSGAGETWAKGLSGLTARDIAAGLSAALISSDPWPPTLPQFRAMCLAVPSLAAVTLAINAKSTPTPFTRLMWQHLDAYHMRTADMGKRERLIRAAYELAREHVMQGKALPPEPIADIAHEKPIHKPAPPDVAEKHLSAIAARLSVPVQETEVTQP
jgi:hypothetical protein